MFHTSNEHLFLPLFLIVIVSFLLFLFLSRNYNPIEQWKVLKVLLLLFIGFYFPIFSYWSSWIFNISIWPDGYEYGEISLLEPSIPNAGIYNVLMSIFSVLSIILLLSISLLLVNLIVVCHPLNKVEKVIIWIPGVNLFVFYKVWFFNSSLVLKLLMILATVTILLFIYYKFLSIPLCLLEFDSFYILESLFLGVSTKEIYEPSDFGYNFLSPCGYEYPYLGDLINGVVCMFLWLSSVLVALIVWCKSTNEHM